MRNVLFLESAPKAAAVRRPPPQGGGETLGAARRLFLMRVRVFLLRGRHASLAGCSGSSRTWSTFRSLRSVRLA